MKIVSKVLYTLLYSLFIILSLLDFFERFIHFFVYVYAWVALTFDVAIIVLSTIGIVKSFKSTQNKPIINLLLATFVIYFLRIFGAQIAFYIEESMDLYDRYFFALLCKSISIILIFVSLALPINKNKKAKLIVSLLSITFILFASFSFTLTPYIIFTPPKNFIEIPDVSCFSIWGTIDYQLIFHFLISFIAIALHIIFFIDNRKSTTEPVVASTTTSKVSGFAFKIRDARKLLDEGLITEEEFKQIKRDIFSKL